jgi:hypothetical protein
LRFPAKTTTTMAEVSDYEQQRLERIAHNRRIMEALGLVQADVEPQPKYIEDAELEALHAEEAEAYDRSEMGAVIMCECG